MCLSLISSLRLRIIKNVRLTKCRIVFIVLVFMLVLYYLIFALYPKPILYFNKPLANGHVESVTAHTGRISQKDMKCHYNVKPEVKYARNGSQFQYMQHNGKFTYAIHAYYDDRKLLLGSKYVRIFMVFEDVKSPSSVNYCCLWAGLNDTKPTIVSASLRGINGKRNIIVNSTYYGNNLISCTLSGIVGNVTHVSLLDHVCDEPKMFLEVVYPQKQFDGSSLSYEHEFGMCLSNGVLFGEFPSNMADSLLEWFEVNRHFGISEFNLYNATALFHPKTQAVLNYYIDKGILNLYQQNPPINFTDRHQRHVADIAMRTSLNDCLYRNMYRYKYTVVIDLDEMIVPRNLTFQNYSQMINYRKDRLIAKPPYDAFYSEELNSVIFRALVFYKTYPKFRNDSDPVQLDITTYRYFNSQPISKSFLNPRLCLAAFSHYCLVKLTGSPQAIFFKMTDATVFHYRNQCMSDENQKLYNEQNCNEREQKKTRFDWMLNFKDKIMDRVTLVKGEISY